MAPQTTYESPAASNVPSVKSWLAVVNWTSAILIAIVFLVAGIWKASDPGAAAVRLMQAKLPESLSVAAALGLGIAETLAGILVLIPRFRRWGSWLSVLLLVAFMIYIAYFYNELRGAECTCFPWVKRAVGPGFFIGDGIMLLFAVLAGIGIRKSDGLRPASIILGAVAVFAFVSWGVAEARHTGARAPLSIRAEDGSTIPLAEGKVFVYFFNPACMHCLEAGRKLAKLNWGDTRVIGVPIETPQFAKAFMDKAGMRGPVSRDVDVLKKTFPFAGAPAAVAIQDGFGKAMLTQFEDAEPAATLKKLGFVN